MFWHVKPAWQLCVPSSHSSTSGTQRHGVRDWQASRPLPAHPCHDLDGYKGFLQHRKQVEQHTVHIQ